MKIKTLSLLVSIAVAWPGLASAETGVTDKEIVIGSCLPLDGPSKEAGVDLDRGAKLFVNYINEKGGIHGRKLRRVTLDDGYDTEKAIACFNQLLKENIFAGAVFYGSPTGAKYMSMAETNRLPILGFAAGAHFFYQPVKRYVFAVRPSFIDETREVIDHLWNDLGARRIAAIYQNDAGGVTILEGVNQALKKYNSRPAAIGSYTRNALDIDPAIDSVRPTDPEVVLLLGPFPPAAATVKRAKELGWQPQFVGVGPRDPFLKAAGPAGEGTILTQVVPGPERSDLKTVALYRKRLKKEGLESPAGYYGLEGFLDMMVLADGIERAGKDLTREKLVDALETMRNIDVGLGPDYHVTYDGNRHGALEKVYSTIVRNGTLKVLDWKALKLRK